MPSTPSPSATTCRSATSAAGTAGSLHQCKCTFMRNIRIISANRRLFELVQTITWLACCDDHCVDRMLTGVGAPGIVACGRLDTM
jgi:hypothetical protein